jgi:lactoylglutathione lyase
MTGETTCGQSRRDTSNALRNVAPLEVGLCVKSIERSVAFYGKLFGFTAVSRVVTAETPAVSSGFADSAYTVVRLQLPTGERLKLFEPVSSPRLSDTGHRPLSKIGFAYLTLIVANIQAAISQLKANGVRERPPGRYQLRPGVEVALVNDPDGNVVELVEYRDLADYRSDLNLRRSI